LKAIHRNNVAIAIVHCVLVDWVIKRRGENQRFAPHHRPGSKTAARLNACGHVDIDRDTTPAAAGFAAISSDAVA
jgi:hypothetical protein